MVLPERGVEHAPQVRGKNSAAEYVAASAAEDERGSARCNDESRQGKERKVGAGARGGGESPRAPYARDAEDQQADSREAEESVAKARKPKKQQHRRHRRRRLQHHYH